jgi:hypothetical protein
MLHSSFLVPFLSLFLLPLVLAALKAKTKTERIIPPGSGPEPAQNPRSPKENDSQDPPPGPPGERGRPSLLFSSPLFPFLPSFLVFLLSLKLHSSLLLPFLSLFLLPLVSAELKVPRQLLRIRPDIFDFEPELCLKQCQTKPHIPGTVPTDRHTTIPNDSCPISACFDDDPKRNKL